jgi:hypothetical protein
VAASVFFLLRAIEWKDDQEGHRWPSIVAAGLSLGIATWGRQPYALLSGVPVLLALQNPRFAKLALVYCGLVGACFIPLAMVWGGLVPPPFQAGSQGIAVKHMLLSLGYTGIGLFLLAPEFYFRVSWRLALGGLALAILANIWLQGLEIYPLQSAVLPYLSQSNAELYGATCGGALIAGGLLFAFLLLHALWKERNDPRRLIAYSGLLICAIHPLFVAGQYSSRYAAMSLPFLVLSANEWPAQSKFRLALACAGTAIGAIALVTYYKA